MVIIGLGSAVLLCNWTIADLNDTRFSYAAGLQLGYLLNQAPRSGSGAISHRVSEVALWCVFRYRSNLPLSDVLLLQHSIPPRVRIQGRLCIYGTSLHRVLWRSPE
jgi:hypothetical protein